MMRWLKRKRKSEKDRDLVTSIVIDHDLIDTISLAIPEQSAFEVGHRARMAEAHQGLQAVDEEHRTVPLGSGKKMVREHGQFDRDQKIARIEWIVSEKYKEMGRKPPPNLRSLIGKML